MTPTFFCPNAQLKQFELNVIDVIYGYPTVQYPYAVDFQN